MAAGAAALQGPTTEGIWPGWIWWGTGSLRGPVGETDDWASPHLSLRVEIDSKAMRKVAVDSVLLLVMETNSAAGTLGINFSSSGRVLYKR